MISDQNKHAQDLPMTLYLELMKVTWEEMDQGVALFDNKETILCQNRHWSNIWELSKSNPQNPEPSLLDILKDNDRVGVATNKAGQLVAVKWQPLELKGSIYKIVFIDKCERNEVPVSIHNKIRFRNKMYETILDSIDEGVTMLDTNSICLYCNSASENIEKIKKKDRIGYHIKEVYPTHWHLSLQAEVIKKQKPVLNKQLSYTASGRHINIISNNYPIFSGEKITGAVSIYQELSKYQKLIEQNIDLQMRLNRQSDSVDRFQSSDHFQFSDIIGQNLGLIALIEKAKKIAKTHSPILLYGETGTGKELFARSMHNSSRNSGEPFLAINCAAIPDNLLEGILFGTAKGVYTGATDRAGLFEQAHKGTLFLDEINSMPLVLQGKLLRVLQEKKIQRLGQKTEIPMKARVISSCNMDPKRMIKEKVLRNDLFYRIAVVYLEIPPLRERKNDIQVLSEYFIHQLNKQLDLSVVSLSHKVKMAFQSYDWPGNVRQLKHSIESAMNILPVDAEYIDVNHLPEYMEMVPAPENEPLSTDHLTTAERDHSILSKAREINREDLKDRNKFAIIKALKGNKGNISKTARDLDMSRQTLQHRLKKYDLKNLPDYLRLSIKNSDQPL